MARKQKEKDHFRTKHIVDIFNSHTEAEKSIKELQREVFGMKKLSILCKDYHPEEDVAGYYNAGD